jgi:hypothetical protein
MVFINGSKLELIGRHRDVFLLVRNIVSAEKEKNV